MHTKYKTALWICWMATVSAESGAVTISEISIAKRMKHDMTISLTADNIINCYDKIYHDPERLVLKIYDGNINFKYGKYIVNRGIVSSISIPPKDQGDLFITIQLNDKASYVIIGTDNILDVNLQVSDNLRIDTWSTSENLYIYSDHDTYHLHDTVAIHWEYAGPGDTVSYCYKINGPKEWVGDSMIKSGSWSEWKTAITDSFKQCAFPVTGKYRFVVKYKNATGVLGEKEVRFSIRR